MRHLEAAVAWAMVGVVAEAVAEAVGDARHPARSLARSLAVEVQQGIDLAVLRIVASGVSALAAADFDEARAAFAAADAIATMQRGLDDLRNSWRALDRWADDGGRA